MSQLSSGAELEMVPSLFEIEVNFADIDLNQPNVKRPDGHWSVRPHMLLNPQQIQNPFPLNPASNHIAPQLVFEVAVSNEIIPTLTVTDLNRYFGPGTGTRAWIGIKIFKNTNPNGIHRWWCGWARRMIVNGQFVDRPDMSNESWPIVHNYHVDLSLPTNTVFHIDVATLVAPLQAPQGYPLTLDLDLEQIRQLILEFI